jgi:hypothetical protein
MVDGFPVLKKNMYTLEEGERSVFDSELKRGGDAEPEVNAMPWQMGNIKPVCPDN